MKTFIIYCVCVCVRAWSIWMDFFKVLQKKKPSVQSAVIMSARLCLCLGTVLARIFFFLSMHLWKSA